MIREGDKVKYRDMVGIVKSINNDMAFVTMPDNKDYAMAYDMLTKEDGGQVAPPTNFTGIISSLRPHLKDMQFLNDFAKEMNSAGVSEISIKNGSILTFTAKESYEEKFAKHRAAALAEAERKAKEEFEHENAQ